MTTTAKTPESPNRFRLPDPPEHPDDKMTSFKQLAATGHAHHLAMHLGNFDTTLVTGGALRSSSTHPKHGRQPLSRPAGGL